MFEWIKPQPELKVREIEIEFFEDEVDVPERPKVRLVLEIKRHHLA
ncbi:hypothetical protein [Thermococcus sp. M36]|nr:hypothetical protein [Thermococcus sp. M36]